MPRDAESTTWSRREAMHALVNVAGAALALLVAGCDGSEGSAEGPCPKGGDHEWYKAASGDRRCRKCGRYGEADQ